MFSRCNMSKLKPKTNSDRTEEGRQETEPAISIQGLEKVYESSDGEVRAVDGVSFDVEPGTAVGILGPNGAGKTTVIKSILSLIVPSDGSIEVAGENVFKESKETFGRIGAMFEGARNVYWRLTVRENVEMFSVIGGRDYKNRADEIDDLIAQFGLSEKSDTVVRELSRGQKQKVTLTCTIARDADIVFLDEPTLGLDVESSLTLQKELRSLVENEDRTVVLSSHNMDVIQNVCDRVIIMNDGEVVVDDKMDSLLNVFDTRTYYVEVAEPIPNNLRQQFKSAYAAKNIERTFGTTSFEVTLPEDEFYEFIEILRREGLTIKSFERAHDDLQDVFLEVTNESGDGDQDE